LTSDYNRCFQGTACPAAAVCVLPGGGESTCPGSCSQITHAGDCETDPVCEWTVCPGCAGAADTGMCTDRRTPVACADLCRSSDCHTIPEAACRGTAGCRPVYCPACDGNHPFAGCLRLNEPTPCEAVSCPADGGLGDSGDDLGDGPDVMNGDAAGP
jgi:hypothetical protein